MNARAGDALKDVFTRNRTEELGYDVWKNFVVPPFYDRLDLLTARKPREIRGGRGCGKTMLLRYLSHQSTFSPDRRDVPADAVEHIGLYWKADTQFSKLMTSRGVPTETWDASFMHLLALALGGEVIESLRSIAKSSCPVLSEADRLRVSLSGLSVFDPSVTGSLDDAAKAIQHRLWEFESWVVNVGKRPEPIFLPGAVFVSALIQVIREQLPGLRQANYFAYLDECENLHPNQQRIINTCLKSSEAPLIFNLAAKRHGFSTQETVGEESVVGIADYRVHDLEDYLLEGEFELFAAEVLFLTLSLAGATELVPIDVELLRDPLRLDERRDERHRQLVLAGVRKLFPGLTQQEMAQEVFQDSVLRRALLKKFEVALKTRGAKRSLESFLRSAAPEASITASALVYRPNLTPDEVSAELDKLESQQPNRFTGSTDWIHNNFVGSLLALYEPLPRVCPFYGGFDAFVFMSRGNLRHFLELCHQSISQAQRTSSEPELPGCVSVHDQAQAARQTSAAFLSQVKSFGRLGDRLHTFVLRLGSLFALAHRRPTQSEPEVSHFAVVRGASSLSKEDSEFLCEAEKWSVLFAEPETKLKSADQPASQEYVFNPIYAPYFHITYRKRRKVELAVDELRILAGGSYDSASALLKRYSKRWDVAIEDMDPTLFSHLLEG